MIPQISKALSSGYTSKQVIDFLLRKFPQHSEKIKSAMAAGFTVEQVLKYIGGGRKALTEEPIEATTEHQQTRKTDIQRRENVNKSALAAGGAAFSPLIASGAQAALSRALPQSLQKLMPGIQNAIASSSLDQGMPSSPQFQGQPQTQTLEMPLSSQQPPINAPNIAQTSGLQQPEGKNIDVGELLNKRGLLKHVEALAKEKRDPKEIAGILYSKYPNEMKDFQKEAGENMEDAIADFMGQQQNMPKNAENLGISPESVENNPENKQINDLLPKSNESVEEIIEPVKKEEIKPKIEKKSIVSTPEGVGEVREIRGDKALVEVDGKIHKVDVEDLEESPLPEKDLADLYDDLLRGIESETGEDVSRMVQWAGYNPKNNTLTFLPYTGKLYKYGNISKEDVELLTDILSTRKTTGENFIGIWKKDSKSPIGAALSTLIKRLQAERGGKGNEYEETHEPIYSAHEPAILAKKNKKKKNK